MELKVKKGRPADAFKRHPLELAVYEMLDVHNIDYEYIDLEEEYPKAVLETWKPCQAFFLCNRQKKDYYLFLVDPMQKATVQSLSKALGIKLLINVNDEDFLEKLWIERDALGLLALMNDPEQKIHLVLDKALAKEATWIIYPNVTSTLLRLKTDDIMKILLPLLHPKYKQIEL